MNKQVIYIFEQLAAIAHVLGPKKEHLEFGGKNDNSLYVQLSEWQRDICLYLMEFIALVCVDDVCELKKCHFVTFKSEEKSGKTKKKDRK